MDQACGTYELLADLRGEVVAVGAGLASLLRASEEDVLSQPVTRFLRGRVMTAKTAVAAPVTVKQADGVTREAIAIRVVQGDRISITVLPHRVGGNTAAAVRARDPRAHQLERLVNEAVGNIQNPLTGIMGFAALGHLAPTTHRRRYYLDQVATQAQRIRRLLHSLVSGVRKSTPIPAPTDLNAEILRSVSSVRLPLEGHGICIDAELPDVHIWAATDAQIMGDALVALIYRGTLEMRKGYQAQEVIVRLSLGEARQGMAELRVVFTGADDPFDLLYRRFSEMEIESPRTSPSLSDVDFHAARQQLRALGGGIRVETNADLEEISLIIEVPLIPPPRQADSTRTPVPLDILAIDDDMMMGELYSELLGVSGHTVTSCRSISAAREALRTRRFDAVISDFFLPDGALSELWAEARADHPELAKRLVLITGQRHNAKVLEWIRRENIPTLAKPFTIKSLLAQLSAVTG